jgi:hypothetical protein
MAVHFAPMQFHRTTAIIKVCARFVVRRNAVNRWTFSDLFAMVRNAAVSMMQQFATEGLVEVAIDCGAGSPKARLEWGFLQPKRPLMRRPH